MENNRCLIRIINICKFLILLILILQLFQLFLFFLMFSEVNNAWSKITKAIRSLLIGVIPLETDIAKSTLSFSEFVWSLLQPYFINNKFIKASLVIIL